MGIGYWFRPSVYIQSPAKARVTKKILLYIDAVRSIRRLSLVIVCVRGSHCNTVLSESLHESVVAASLLNSASKGKKEGGRVRCVCSAIVPMVVSVTLVLVLLL